MRVKFSNLKLVHGSGARHTARPLGRCPGPWPRRCLAWSLAVVTVCLGWRALAGSPTIAAYDRPVSGPVGYLGLETGPEMLGARLFLGTHLAAGYQDPGAIIHLGLPLRLDLDAGGLRPRDWDEPEDLAGVVERLELGGRGGPLHVAFGPMDGVSLGHGTLVDGYLTGLDPDDRARGVRVAGVLGPGRVEAVVGDVLAPRFLAGRASARLRLPWSGGLEVGAFVARDELPTVAVEPCGTGCDGDRISIDESGELVAGSWTSFLGWGFDAGLVVLDARGARLTIYSDLVLEEGLGRGLYSGMAYSGGLGHGVSAALRLEYRYLGAGSLPTPFGVFHRYDRWGIDGLPPKDAAAARSAGHGWLGELALELAGVVKSAVTWRGAEDREELVMRLELPGEGRVRGALFAASSAQDPGGLVSPRLLAAEARFMLSRAFYLGGRIARYPAPNPNGERYSPFAPELSWWLGVGLAARLLP